MKSYMNESLTESMISSLCDKSKQFFIVEQAVSIAKLQIHLRVKYNIAVRIVERLEADGVVGPLNDKGVRQLRNDYLLVKGYEGVQSGVS